MEGARPRAGASATLLATLGGVGYFPVASGTAGSAATLVLWWVALRLGGPWTVVGLAAFLAVAGTWAASRLSAAVGFEDPPEVVVDEAAGMLLSLAFLPAGWGFTAAAFVLFRILDIIKPWPAGAAERLPGGFGIMADDLIVAIYTNVLLQLAARWVAA